MLVLRPQLKERIGSLKGFLAAIKACSSSKDLEKGKAVHAELVRSGLSASNVYIASSLVNMYAKCGSIGDAKTIFDKMPFRDAVAWNALMLGYVENREEDAVLELFVTMKDGSARADAITFVAALKACTGLAGKEEGKQIEGKHVKVESLEHGMSIHSEAAACGFDLETIVGGSLIEMYARCGSLLDSRRVFDRMVCHDVVCWTTLMLGYVEAGEADLALELLACMEFCGCAPNARSFVAALKACTCLAVREKEGKTIDGKLVKAQALKKGAAIHLQASKRGFETDMYVASSLVNMYGKCGRMEEARKVFDNMKKPDVVSWNALIVGYVENGEEEVAMNLFFHMRLKPDAITFCAVGDAIISLAARESAKLIDGKLVKVKSLERGMALHMEAVRCGLEFDKKVSNSLFGMYAKCGSLEDARRLFDKMQNATVSAWAAMISAYTETGEAEEALALFRRCMRLQIPDARAFVAALKACIVLAEREEGKQVDGKLMKTTSLNKGSRIHAQAVQVACDSDIYVACTLITMYAKCGSVADARKVFDGMSRPDLVSWNALISGHVENGEGETALEFFTSMQSCCAPDSFTFSAAIDACSALAVKEEGTQISDKLVKLKSLEKGMAIHSGAAQLGCDSDIFVSSAVINMYAKCGSLWDARRAFDRMKHHNVVSWTTLILGYVEAGEAEVALRLFYSMPASSADCRAFGAAVKACTALATSEEGQKIEGRLVKLQALEQGMAVHSRAIKCGCEDGYVMNMVVDMYAKCGSMFDARGEFDRMSSWTRNSASWTSLLLGYVESGEAELALDIFAYSRSDPDCRAEFDALALVAALKACGALVALQSAKAIHAEACRCGFETTAAVKSSLMDVYGKCGSMIDAGQVFESASGCRERDDPVLWCSLMAGYSRQGDWKQVVQVFHRMKEEGVALTPSAFVCLLTACSHAGLVDTGKQLLDEKTMWDKFGLRPSIEHYSCMVDILSRSNQLEVAVQLVKRMSSKKGNIACMWRSLLGGSSKWMNEAVGRVAFDALVELGEADAGDYVLMANLYRSKERYRMEQSLRSLWIGTMRWCCEQQT